MGRPEPQDDLQRILLELVYERFQDGARWAPFALIDHEFDQQHPDVDILDVARSMPEGLLNPQIRSWDTEPSGPFQLTLAGVVAATQGRPSWDESAFLGAVGLAVKIARAWKGWYDDPPAPPALTASDVIQQVWKVRRLDQLSDVLSHALIVRLGYLLAGEPFRWQGRNRVGEADWSLTIDREIRRYASVESMAAYWAIRDMRQSENTNSSPEWPASQDISRTPSDKAVDQMDVTSAGLEESSSKVFISHASADRKVADLVKDTLVLGGLSAADIFYSSDRGTGIATGTDLRPRLRDELQQAALVIEILTETFVGRPVCMLELGGAWALEKPTYPIIVPPMTFAAASARIGEILMASLGQESDIDDMFHDLPEQLRSANARFAVKFEPRHVREFKNRLATVLAERPSSSFRLAPTPATDGGTTKNPAAGAAANDNSQRAHAGTHEQALAREIERICLNATAQGWRVRTNSDTTLRLEDPRGKRFTLSIEEADVTRAQLREFAAQLRAQGLRVNRTVRRPVSGAAAPRS